MIEIIGAELTQWDIGRVVKITGIDAEQAHFANKGDSKAVIMSVVGAEAKIPDYLLQTGKQLCVYAVKDGITIESKAFYVKNRERPETYSYEDDQRNYIYELITNAEDAIDSANAAADEANRVARELQEARDNGEFTPVKGVDYFTPEDKAEFAPSGYGLGTMGSTCKDCNLALKSGFYSLSGEACLNTPPSFTNMKYGAMLVLNRYDTYIAQIIFYQKLIAVRYSNDGGNTWAEWEHLNPPMVANTEYRTMERYKEYSVYKKVDANGNILWRRDGESQWHLLSSADYVATATVE